MIIMLVYGIKEIFMTEQEKERFENVKYVLENQQKEMRAYDQKAGAYITSNSGLFVIALFTLCIFGMFHGNEKDIQPFSAQWVTLMILTTVYALLFVVANTLSLLVLFPRIKNRYKFNEYDKTITNFISDTVFANLDTSLNNTIKNFETYAKEHIKANVGVLRAKHKYAMPILWLSLGMALILVVSLILLFVF